MSSLLSSLSSSLIDLRPFTDETALMDENGPAVDASRCKKSKHSVNIVLEIKDVHIVTTALPVTI